MKRGMKRAAAVLFLIAAGAASVSAQQDRGTDGFAGYSMLRSGEENLHGWHVALGIGVSGRVGILVDASGHQATDASGTDLSAFSVMAGPRVSFGGGRVRPFLHVLAGLVRSKAGIEVSGVEITESTSDAGGAAGGGVDLGFGERWALRGAADYRLTKADDETVGDPRFSAGVVYRFGR
jgi:hypothetical protein